MSETNFRGLLPYLNYEDVGPAMDWLSEKFGFVERSRYIDADGVVQQAEMRVGDMELWIGCRPKSYWAERGGKRDTWIGVWVDDVDALYERVRAAGVECEEPVDRDYDVRSFNVFDPEGVHWGFLKRLGTGYVQTIPTAEGGLQEILAPT